MFRRTLFVASVLFQLNAGQVAAVTIAAAGDTLSTDHAGELRLLDATAPYFRQADLGFVNLEGVLMDPPGTARACGRSCYRFRMPETMAGYMRAAGITVVSSANNHSADFGAQGQRSTVQALIKQGLASVGLAISPYAVAKTSTGTNVAVIGYSPHQGTLSMFDIPAMQRQVRALKQQGAIVVVSLHAGAEGNSAWYVPRGEERFLGDRRGDVYAFAHSAVDAGADLVLGHGPHVLRAMEMYKNRLIAYSLGNFATNGPVSLSGLNQYGGILQVALNDVTGAFEGARFIGTSQTKSRKDIGPQLDARATQLLADITARTFSDPGLSISTDGTIRATR